MKSSAFCSYFNAPTNRWVPRMLLNSLKRSCDSRCQNSRWYSTTETSLPFIWSIGYCFTREKKPPNHDWDDGVKTVHENAASACMEFLTGVMYKQNITPDAIEAISSSKCTGMIQSAAKMLENNLFGVFLRTKIHEASGACTWKQAYLICFVMATPKPLTHAMDRKLHTAPWKCWWVAHSRTAQSV